MRVRVAEIVSFAVCIALLLLIPLLVALIVASPFEVYHFVVHGWAGGWRDLIYSLRFIGYFWGFLVAACLLWGSITHFWGNRGQEAS